MARRNVFPELKREALERVNAGESTVSVAAELGVSPTSVKNWIKGTNYKAIGGQGQQSAVDAMQYAVEAEGYRHRKIPVAKHAPSRVDIFIYVGQLCVGVIECKKSIVLARKGSNSLEALAYSAIGQLMVHAKNKIVCGYLDRAREPGIFDIETDIARLLRAKGSVPNLPMAIAFAASMTDEGIAFFGNVNDERDDKIESKFKLWFEDLGINFIVCGRSRDGSDDDDSFAYDDGKSKFLSRMNEYRMLIKEPLERVAESLDNVFSFLNTIQDEDSACTNRASVDEALSVLGQLYDNFDTSEKTQRGDFDDVRSYLFAIGVAQMSAKRQDYETAIERISKLRTRLRADLEALAANVVVNGARKARC